MTKFVYAVAVQGLYGFDLFEDKDEAVARYNQEKANTIALFKIWNDECVYLYELEINNSDDTDELNWFDFRDDGERIDVAEGLCGEFIEEI